MYFEKLKLFYFQNCPQMSTSGKKNIKEVYYRMEQNDLKLIHTHHMHQILCQQQKKNAVNTLIFLNL